MKALVYQGPGKRAWHEVPPPPHRASDRRHCAHRHDDDLRDRSARPRHGKPVQLRLQDLWIHNITISMGLVNTNTTPMLLKLITEGRLNVDKFASHHFRLDDMLAAYDTFGRAAETKALKVIIER